MKRLPGWWMIHLTRKMMVKGGERGFKAKRALIKLDCIKLIHSRLFSIYLLMRFLITKSPKLLTLKFEYFLKLNVVCVGVEGSLEGPENNILCNLFPSDTGTELPHQVWTFVLPCI
jgi:hypothetical protein